MNILKTTLHLALQNPMQTLTVSDIEICLAMVTHGMQRPMGRPKGPSYQQNKGESRYSTRWMVLITNARVTDRIRRTCAISNSDSQSNVLDRSASGSPNHRS
ncbi:hypothetical protein J6590_092054 [Homalodisca vitripennis]|nr:hypothetical protein J6590_092054 [Homalodisca vitripennis]